MQLSRSKQQVVHPPHRPRRGRRALKISVGLVLIAIIGLVAVPMVSPDLGASMADTLRSIIGPEPVAQLESVSFKIQDAVNQIRYQLSGGQSQLSWADTPQPTVTKPVPTQAPTLAPVVVASKSMTPTVTAAPTRTPVPTATPLPNVLDAQPQLDNGWQAFGPTNNGQPIMARASVKPDPARPYAQVALIRFDLAQVELHLVPGTTEPTASQVITSLLRPGDIPAEVQTSDQLLAAFNGGFKAIHGHYGMMVDQVVIQPPLDGIATLAFYGDGQIKLGAWGRDITTTLNLVSYRQNCPLLVDAGQINPSVTNGSRRAWGYTVNNVDTTWRSGLGLSRDGRFLIYAVGNSLTVEALANALQQGGAFNAMQLDINGFYTRFVTYQATSSAQTTGGLLVAHKLLTQMSGDPAQFLKPYARDFFYVTTKQG